MGWLSDSCYNGVYYSKDGDPRIPHQEAKNRHANVRECMPRVAEMVLPRNPRMLCSYQL